MVAELLKMNRKMLFFALTQRTIVSGVSKKASLINVLMNNDQVQHTLFLFTYILKAIYSRDALAKNIYFRLFSWIVDKINKKISQQVHDASQGKLLIGILDIYGFEIFKVNSFEVRYVL